MDASEFVPAGGDLAALRKAAAGCRGCPLYAAADQTVFGAGDPHAAMMLVGEVPGDQEDRQGAPFVGPAGRLLDRALAEAGIDRDKAYLTNAVKHFKFTTKGKRRIHETPERAEIRACRPWLVAELDLVRPRLIVALGAVAGKALLGPGFRVTQQRGTPVPCPPYDQIGAPASEDAPGDTWIVATLHPSAVLRATDRDAAYAGVVADLEVAAARLRQT